MTDEQINAAITFDEATGMFRAPNGFERSVKSKVVTYIRNHPDVLKTSKADDGKSGGKK